MKRRGLWLGLVLLVLAGICWSWFVGNSASSGGGGGFQQGAGAQAGGRERPREAVLPPAERLAAAIRSLKANALSSGDAASLRRDLLRADPDAAIAAIRDFLTSGNDAVTGETFEVGPRGELLGAPTLRVLLLDLLGRIARDQRSDVAGEVSRELMKSKTSADEWAVALRNVGWATPDDRAYLSRKTAELIDHPPWQREPTAGYQEAFDVIVFLRDTRFIPTLGGMVEGSSEALQFTAAATLDRLAAADPLAVMDFLNAHPEILAGSPMLAADHFAKADLSQPAQRTAVERWLDRADVEIEAKAKLIGSLGYPGVFVSENLLTSTPPPSEGGLPSGKKQALKRAVDGWLETNRYPGLAEPLQEKLGELE